jgi:hypothetical protein
MILMGLVMVRSLVSLSSVALIFLGLMDVSSSAQIPTLEAALPQLANITLQNNRVNYKGSLWLCIETVRVC